MIPICKTRMPTGPGADAHLLNAIQICKSGLTPPKAPLIFVCRDWVRRINGDAYAQSDGRSYIDRTRKTARFEVAMGPFAHAKGLFCFLERVDEGSRSD